MSSLRRTAVKGFLWQVFGLFGQRGAAFVASIVLARLLAPEDFGVVAIAISIITFAELIRAGGLVPAYIAHQGDEPQAGYTVFWLSLVGGFGLFLLMFFGAPLMAQWFEAPGLTPIVRALSFTQLIDSFRTVPFSILVREYRFKEKSIADSAPMLVAVPAAIVAAVLLPVEQKAWSLVVMYLVRYFLSTAIVWRYEPLKVRAVFDVRLARVIAGEGRKMLASIIPSGALDPLTRIGLGSRVDLGSVGVFNLANSVTTPATFLAHAANWTLYPILSNNREDPERVERYLLRSLKSVGLLSIGALAWLALVAPTLVPIVFGERWLPLVVPTQWLCLATAFRNYALLTSNALLAIKKQTFAMAIWWLALGLVVGLLALYPMPPDSAVLPSQLVAVGLGASWALAIVLTARAFRLSAEKVLPTVLVPLVPSAVAAGVAFLARPAFGAHVQTVWGLLGETALFLVVFLPLGGKMLGGGWLSLMTPKGVKSVVRGPQPPADSVVTE